MFSPQDIKVKLKEMAAELKFDDLRICDVGDFPESDKTKFYNCMNLGMFDKMEYLKRAAEKKISPTKYFPKAKSAVCVCANFWRESSEKRIALYAQSEDYHRVIKPKLLMLSKLLEEFGGEQKVSVDSSPLWEKLLAARAGLGWIGKNTLLTRETNGSWNFIGIILTSLALPFDEQIKNKCGNCRECVDACPTSALSENGLDARKCISNLTIERKDELSDEEKKLVGNIIYGCDVCLRACPFGKKAPISPLFTNLPNNNFSKRSIF